MINKIYTIEPTPGNYDYVTFTRGPMHINHFYEISKHGINALRVYQYIRTIQGLRYPGSAENSHKWVKVDNKKLYEWFGVSQPKKWDVLKRLSDKNHKKFTTQILEVKNGGTGKLPQARIILPKKKLH